VYCLRRFSCASRGSDIMAAKLNVVENKSDSFIMFMKDVTDGDKGVRCDSCELWFQSKCGDVSPELYKTLQKFSGEKLGTRLYW